MKRLLPLLVPLLLVPACGGDPSPPSSVDENDERAVALWCMQELRDLDARPEGERAIAVGDPDTGPRVRFFLTGGQAEAFQFEGEAEGAEQISDALLFVRQASDDVLEDVEYCLDSY